MSSTPHQDLRMGISPFSDDVGQDPRLPRFTQSDVFVGSVGSRLPAHAQIRAKSFESSSDQFGLADSGHRLFAFNKFRGRADSTDYGVNSFSSESLGKSSSGDGLVALPGRESLFSPEWDSRPNFWLQKQERFDKSPSPRADEDWVNDWFGGMEISPTSSNEKHMTQKPPYGQTQPRLIYSDPPPSSPLQFPDVVRLTKSEPSIVPPRSHSPLHHVKVPIPSDSDNPVQVVVSPGPTKRPSKTELISSGERDARKQHRSQSPRGNKQNSKDLRSLSPTPKLLPPQNNYSNRSPSPSKYLPPLPPSPPNSYGGTSNLATSQSSPRNPPSPRNNGGQPSSPTNASSNKNPSPRQGNSKSPRQPSNGPPKNKGRNKGSLSQAKKEAEMARFEIDLSRVISGDELRTSLMIKNIPNKYNQEMLLETVNETHKGTYDFFYLPIDFKNKCNVGYAFVNFIDPQSIPTFYNRFNNQKWSKFNSSKVCQITYARIQGKLSFVEHFRNSSLMHEDPKCRPLIFYTHGPNAGQPKPFPTPTTPSNSSSTPTKSLQQSAGDEAQQDPDVESHSEGSEEEAH